MKEFIKAILYAIRDYFVKGSIKPDVDGASGSLVKKIAATGYDREREEEKYRRKILASMRHDLGDDYVFGAKALPDDEETDEWDCSGKIKDAFNDAGMEFPHGSGAQFNYCRPIEERKPCDLGFLDNSKKPGVIGHIMMLTDRGTVIHAVGGRGVVEDPVSMWENHKRFRGWRRHPNFIRSKEDQPDDLFLIDLDLS